MMNEVIRCYPTRIHELLELELNEKFKIKNYDGEYYLAASGLLYETQNHREPESVKNARAKLTAHLSKNKPVAPLKGPLSLFVKWCFPAKSHKPGTWRDTRPDTDNLQKLLKDCMTICGFWTDDSQVAQEIIEKFWWDTPGIYICIRQLEDKA